MKIMTLAFAAAALLATPVLAQDAPKLPSCSATVKDGCQQTAAQQARAMSGEQADKRDAAHGGAWAPNTRATGAVPIAEGSTHKKAKPAHHAKKVTKTTVTTTTTAEPAK